MAIRSDEITSIIRSEIKGFDEGADVSGVGTVVEVGDGIAQVHGLSGVLAQELVEFANGVMGMAFNLEEETVGVIILGDYTSLEGGRPGQDDRPHRRGAGRRRAHRPRGERARRADRRQGPDQRQQDAPDRAHRPGRDRAAAGRHAGADRHQGHRRDDPDRPRPARADHRRPPDRQDGRSRSTRSSTRRATTCSASTSPSARSSRQVAQIVAHAGAVRRAWSTPSSCSPGAADPAPLQFLAPYAGVAMGEEFMEHRARRADRLRRPLEARLGLPPGVAAAAPPAGPRGVPGRRLLPALPPAGALRASERGERRRVADRAADHRDAGQRRVGLHPDQRHLHHRRPDLPGGRPVQRRVSARR